MMIPAIIAERRRWLVSVRAEDQTRRGLVRFKLDFDNVHPTRCLFEVTRQSGDGRDQSGDLLSRNPITGIAGGCARAASGHAAAAPPSAASNSRSPMVTVIRPSRARWVKWKDITPLACCLNRAAPKAGWSARPLGAGRQIGDTRPGKAFVSQCAL